MPQGFTEPICEFGNFDRTYRFDRTIFEKQTLLKPPFRKENHHLEIEVKLINPFTLSLAFEQSAFTSGLVNVFSDNTVLYRQSAKCVKFKQGLNWTIKSSGYLEAWSITSILKESTSFYSVWCLKFHWMLIDLLLFNLVSEMF